MKGANPNIWKGAVILAWLAIIPVFAGKPFTHRFIYANTGFSSRGIDTCIGRMRAAASLGYNGYVVTNWEDNHLENQGQVFLNNAKRAVSEAKALDIALIPRHFYEADAAYNDFNLAEAFPVRGTKFKVKDGRAAAVSDHETGFQNGDFEMATSGKPDGWRLINLPGATVLSTGAKSGDNYLQLSGGGFYARIQQKVKLTPNRAYRLSAWISTKSVGNFIPIKFQVYVNQKEPLLGKKERPFGTPYDNYHKDGIWTTVSPSQGWKFCQSDFNSLHYSEAFVEFVVAKPTAKQVGTVWIDDMRLEEVGLYETVRSPTRPIVVKSADGSKTYREGTDYIVDPKCNIFTIKSFWYNGHLQIPEGSPIQDGQELRVDWYQMADPEQVFPNANFCMSETWKALEDNVQRMDELYGHGNQIFLGYDEWRTAFWDDRCELFPKAKTAGDYMAGTLKKTVDLLWRLNPCREAYVWSDMYDPYHNAYWPYYAMTNGGCQTSWKNMDTNIVIVNWNACGLPWYEKSLRFYMGLDDSLNPDGKVYRQILSVMDGGRVGTWLKPVEKAEKEGGRGIIGIQYVDWRANFSQMTAVKNACLAYGRWGTGPLPGGTCVGIDSRDEPKERPLAATPSGVRFRVNGCEGRVFEIEYAAAKYGRVTLKAFDLQGRLIHTLVDSNEEMGTRRIAWDASHIPNGVYFLRLTVDGGGHQVLKQVVF